jgi:hypothetical protein
MHGTFQMKHRQFCMFNEHSTRLSEFNALAASLKENDAYLRFQVLYLPAS